MTMRFDIILLSSRAANVTTTFPGPPMQTQRRSDGEGIVECKFFASLLKNLALNDTRDLR